MFAKIRPLMNRNAFPVARFTNTSSGNVGGHQVGGELNAFEADVQNLRDGADEQRFRQPRHADEQAVTAGEDRGEHLLDHFALPDDDPPKLIEHCDAVGGKLIQVIREAVSG